MYIGNFLKVNDNAPQYVKDFILTIQENIKESGNDTKFKITLPLYFPREKEPLTLYGNRIQTEKLYDEQDKIINSDDITIKLSDNGIVLRHLREKNIDIDVEYESIFNDIISGFNLEKGAITTIIRFSKQSEKNDLFYETEKAYSNQITESEKVIFCFEKYLGVLHKVYNLPIIAQLINNKKSGIE